MSSVKVDAQPTWKTKLPKQVLNSLTLNNQRITDGSETVVINPGYQDVEDDKIIQSIEEILSTCDLTPELRKIEDSNISKFGPRSLAKKWEERKESLYDYFNKEDVDSSGEFKSANGRLRISSIDKSVQQLVKASNAGLPYMQKKGLILEQAKSDYRKNLFQYPCVLFTRTQEQGKTRNVFGYPIADTLFEYSFYIPYLRYEKTLPFRSALIGPDAVDAAITLMLSRLTPDKVVLCVDFSSFDASVTPQLSHNAFVSISNLFQTHDANLLYSLYRRFCTIGIYTPDGELSGPHGVPSGSAFTNAIDSLVQFQCSGMLPHECQIQGDDGVYIVSRNDHDLLLERFDSAGLKVNRDKSNSFDTKEAIYLQRYYHPNYLSRMGGLGGVYAIARAMLRIKYLERWTDFEQVGIEGADFFSLRTISILENCKHHPGFAKVVKLAHSFDKFGLNFTGQGLKAYSRSQESKTRAGVFNQYGSLEKGINRFETMKILKTL